MTPPQVKELPTCLPSPRRLIAIGDLRGDVEKSKKALRLACRIDASNGYNGGSANVVQVGDVLDHGGDELKILYFLEKLKREAARSEGRIITKNENHEIMNVEGDFCIVTEPAVEEFRVWAEWFIVGNKLKSLRHGLGTPKSRSKVTVPQHVNYRFHQLTVVVWMLCLKMKSCDCSTLEHVLGKVMRKFNLVH